MLSVQKNFAGVPVCKQRNHKYMYSCDVHSYLVLIISCFFSKGRVLLWVFLCFVSSDSWTDAALIFIVPNLWKGILLSQHLAVTTWQDLRS